MKLVHSENWMVALVNCSLDTYMTTTSHRSPRQIPVHILMSLVNKYHCILLSLSFSHCFSDAMNPTLFSKLIIIHWKIQIDRYCLNWHILVYQFMMSPPPCGLPVNIKYCRLFKSHHQPTTLTMFFFPERWWQVFRRCRWRRRRRWW